MCAVCAVHSVHVHLLCTVANPVAPHTLVSNLNFDRFFMEGLILQQFLAKKRNILNLNFSFGH